MARRTKNSTANGAPNGSPYGDSNGEDTVQVRSKNGGAALDFDEFLVQAQQQLHELAPLVYVTRSRFRLGEIALEPLETLEARCRTKWRGRRVVLVLRAKGLDGRIALQATLPIDEHDAVDPDAPPPASTGGDAAVVLALMKRLEAMDAQVRDMMHARAASPAPGLTDQVGALGAIAGVLKDLGGGAAGVAKAAGLTPEDALKLIDVGKALAGGKVDSFAHKALEMFGPAGIEVLKTSAALMMLKLTNATEGEKKKQDEPAAKPNEGQGT